MMNKNTVSSFREKAFAASGYVGFAGSIFAVVVAATGAVAATAVAPFLFLSFAVLAVSGVGQLTS